MKFNKFMEIPVVFAIFYILSVAGFFLALFVWGLIVKCPK